MNEIKLNNFRGNSFVKNIFAKESFSQEPSERKDIGLIDAKKPVQNQILKGSEGMMKEYYEELDKQQTSVPIVGEDKMSSEDFSNITTKPDNQPKSTEGSLDAAQRSSQQILFLQLQIEYDSI